MGFFFCNVSALKNIPIHLISKLIGSYVCMLHFHFTLVFTVEGNILV